MRARRVVIALPVILTLLIALVIGGLITLQNQRQSQQVGEADAVAQDYLADVETFRSGVVDRISRSKQTDPGALRRIVDKAIARPPKLADAPAYGRQNSSTYAEAAQTQATVLGSFKRLSSTLRRADTALGFIVAARKVLTLRATDYLGFGLITSSSPVRSELIPAFVEARDEFARVPVPKGKEELAAMVLDAAQYVIDQATVLAQRVESRQSFAFSYQEQFQRAADAVSDFGTQVKGDIAEAINAVTADS
ncbi:hypothetical protein [Aeromicrobium sp.]|uniref:hypothetical protein n=1 Tax=Aeromicrobium sp. TaxID=1871063 RepID=UPI0030BFD698